MACLLCNDTGEYIDNVTGLKIECKCRVERKQKEEQNKKKIELVKQAELMKASNNAERYVASELKLIPEQFRDVVFDMSRIKEHARESFNSEKQKIVGIEDYIGTLSEILTSIRNGEKLKKSYIISAPNGYSKSTFAYTCISDGYHKGLKMVPYTSLIDIYNQMCAEQLYYKLSRTMIVNRSRFDYENEYYVSKDKSADESDERRIAFSDELINKYVNSSKLNNFTYKDYEQSDVLFVYLSGTFVAEYELQMLQFIMTQRANTGLPTVVFTNKAIKEYATNRANYSILCDILARNKYEVNSLDRLNSIACYRKGDEI